MSTRDLKDYIVKLNDRNIQRQRETGFTVYAILAAIVVAFFFLVDNISTFFQIINSTNALSLTTLTNNGLLALLLLLVAGKVADKKRPYTKIYPSKTLLKLDFQDLPLLLFFALTSALNLICFTQSNIRFNRNYFLALGVFSGTNLIIPIAIDIIKIFRRKSPFVDHIDFTVGTKPMVKKTIVTYSISFLLLLLSTIVAFRNIETSINYIHLSPIVKYTSVTLGLLFLAHIALRIQAQREDNDYLEEFEKDIFFENLTNDDIVGKFEAEFAGIPFSKWIIQKHREIINFFDKQQQEFLKSDKLQVELAAIDKNLSPSEYRTSLQNIVNHQLSILSHNLEYINGIRSTFNMLKVFGSLNEEEIRALSTVGSYLNSSIDEFNIKYNALSNTTKKLTVI